jgi:hypothetical protein
MPRFHFHAEDGHRDLDREGAELPDLAAAQVEAARYMAELLRERPGEVWRQGSLRVIVTDADGAMLGVLALIGLTTPTSSRDGEAG